MDLGKNTDHPNFTFVHRGIPSERRGGRIPSLWIKLGICAEDFDRKIQVVIDQDRIILKEIIVKKGTIYYHGTTWRIKKGDIFNKFDESIETYVTDNEKAAEFFSGDLEDPKGDPVVIKLVVKKDLRLTTKWQCSPDLSFDGMTRRSKGSFAEYEDTVIFKPNDVLHFLAYKVRRKSRWSDYIPFIA